MLYCELLRIKETIIMGSIGAIRGITPYLGLQSDTDFFKTPIAKTLKIKPRHNKESESSIAPEKKLPQIKIKSPSYTQPTQNFNIPFKKASPSLAPVTNTSSQTSETLQALFEKSKLNYNRLIRKSPRK